MKKNYLLLAILIVIGISASLFILFSIGKKVGLITPQVNQPPAIFDYLTGEIGEIKDNVITVSGKVGQGDAKTYKVIINKDTQFIGQILAKPIYLQSTITQPQTLNLTDFKVGDNIIIKTSLNLRNPSIKEIPALSIQFPAYFDTLYGKLLQVGTDTIVIRAIDPTSLARVVNPERPSEIYVEKDYTIKISSETQVFKVILPPDNPTKPSSEIASLSDLKKDQKVRVYSDTDVTATDQITAKYIEIDTSPQSAPPAASEPTP